VTHLTLHQEKPLDVESQQALAIASSFVSEDAQQILQPMVQEIQALAQKVQEAQQAKAQNMAMSDPTAQAIIKTQMAETERKTAEFQAKVQAEMQKEAQNYQLEVAKLQAASPGIGC